MDERARAWRGPQPRRAAVRRLAAAAAAATLGVAPALADTGSLEFPVKATFLFKFASYVEWPAQAFATAAAPVTVCVVGRDPFGAMLDGAVRGQRTGARAVVVRRLPSAAQAGGCHVAFVGGSREHSTAESLKALYGRPILTVTDDRQAGPRGVIHFVVVADRVRFRIDLRLARASGLTISSKLLNLAVEVDR